MEAQHVYEIEFDVRSQARTAYQEWLARGLIDWINHDAVAEFAVYRNEEGTSPEIKYYIGFDTPEKWLTFLNSDDHAAAIAKLTGLTEDLTATLWERDSLSLTDEIHRHTDGGTVGEPIEEGHVR